MNEWNDHQWYGSQSQGVWRRRCNDLPQLVQAVITECPAALDFVLRLFTDNLGLALPAAEAFGLAEFESACPLCAQLDPGGGGPPEDIVHLLACPARPASVTRHFTTEVCQWVLDPAMTVYARCGAMGRSGHNRLKAMGLRHRSDRLVFAVQCVLFVRACYLFRTTRFDAFSQFVSLSRAYRLSDLV